MKLKTKLLYLLFKTFPKIFIKQFLSAYNHKLNYNLLNLLKKGLKINIIFDIGAFRGEWSKLLSETSLKKKEFYLFEANEENRNFLEKLNFKFFLKVLSDQNKDVNFYSNLSTGDSYLKEQTSFYSENLQPSVRKAITLDELVKKEKIPLPDFLKIDTQGSELDILKGSKESLSQCSLIYLECPIVEYNLNAPKLNEYIDYLNSINFVPLDICEIHKMDNVLIQIDILFIRKTVLNKFYPEKKTLNILNYD